MCVYMVIMCIFVYVHHQSPGNAVKMVSKTREGTDLKALYAAQLFLWSVSGCIIFSLPQSLATPPRLTMPMMRTMCMMRSQSMTRRDLSGLKQMKGWMAAWMVAWLDGWLDGWTCMWDCWLLVIVCCSRAVRAPKDHPELHHHNIYHHWQLLPSEVEALLHCGRLRNCRRYSPSGDGSVISPISCGINSKYSKRLCFVLHAAHRFGAAEFLVSNPAPLVLRWSSLSPTTICDEIQSDLNC